MSTYPEMAVAPSLRSRRVPSILTMMISMAAWSPSAWSADQQGAHDIAIALRPAAPDSNGVISSVTVTETLNVDSIAAGAAFLRMPQVLSNVQTVADSLSSLEVVNAGKTLKVTARDDPAGSDPVYRRWVADRPVKGPVIVSYTAPITNEPNRRGAAPPFELRSEDGGFSAVSGAFLIVPEGEARYDVQIRWDFSALPPGAMGVSTFGVGGARSSKALTTAELEAIYLMGGAIHSFPATYDKPGFFSAWQGRLPFDGAVAMGWTKRLYDSYLTFFSAPQDKPYSVFLRRNLINAGGGVEVGDSFVATFDATTQLQDLKLTLAHEMVHTFVGSLDAGHESLSLSWFSEGLAVYYERVLPYRAGLITADDFLRDLNTTAARYYTDALNNTPNSEIDKRFWADTRVRVLPYDRGGLYFAALDEKVRRHSKRRRSLDDLVRSMLDRRRSGKPMDEAAWIETISTELGPEGVADFNAMLAGTLVVPPSDSFGHCFVRTSAPLRRYDLGFTSDVLIEPARVVRGLEPGSAAARAGLQDGDSIVKPVPQDRIQSDQTALLQLSIQRDGKPLEISYLPRSETVEAYQWRRAEDCSAENRGGPP
jgi:predicted metalloprotease with PDZ domain